MKPDFSFPDSHCHLDFETFDQDRDQVINAARMAGVSPVITICTRLGELAKTLRIVDRHEDVFFAAGVHPHWSAVESDVTVEDLTDMTSRDKMVAIGECGLDYHYTRDTALEQKSSFRLHVEAARNTGLPVVVHSRDADSDMMTILGEEYSKGSFKCIMHCYSSGAQLAEFALERGFYLSISGIVTFKGSTGLRDIVSRIPLDRLLVETDAPYLSPVPCRGRRNEPAHVMHTARYLSSMFEMEMADFARIIHDNTLRAFPRLKHSIMPDNDD